MKDVIKKVSRTVRVILCALIFIVLFDANASSNVIAYEVDGKGTQTETVFRYGQYVMVTLKNGTEVPGKIAGVKSKKKYYVNEIGGEHHGVVHKKYIRKMSASEIEHM